MSCKHIRREGESCRLNNDCTYPDCPIEFINSPHIEKDFYSVDWSLLDDPELFKDKNDAG